MERVTDPADPHRCKASVGNGQCWNRALDGSDYCHTHARAYQPPEKGLRGYLLADARSQALLTHFAEDEEIKSLRDEIAFTRMMVKMIWDSAKSDSERLLLTTKVRGHIQDLQKLVTSCNQIEERLGSLLAKSTLRSVGQQICQKIVDRLEKLPGAEQFLPLLMADIFAVIRDARNDAITVSSVPVLPPPTEPQ